MLKLETFSYFLITSRNPAPKKKKGNILRKKQQEKIELMLGVVFSVV